MNDSLKILDTAKNVLFLGNGFSKSLSNNSLPAL